MTIGTMHGPDTGCGMFDVYPGSRDGATHERHYDADTDPCPIDAYAWPGGYTLTYYADDGTTYCARHAWPVIVREDTPMVRDVYWEGPDMWCEEGSHPIASEYGDPDEEA